MGWVEDLGLELLQHAVAAFHPDVILVIANDRVAAVLAAASTSVGASATVVVKLPRSGGVVERSSEVRRSARDRHVRQYFYGRLGNLTPHAATFPAADVRLIRVINSDKRVR